MWKKKIFENYGFLKCFGWSRNPYLLFPKYGKSEFKQYRKSMGKHRDFPYSSLPRRFRADENPYNSQCLEMHKFP